MNPFVKRHQQQISGVLSCFDRVVITGTLPDICHAGAMAGFLSYHNIRLFDYAQWAEPFREELRQHAEKLAKKADLKIEFIRKYKAFRKEERIKAIVEQRARSACFPSSGEAGSKAVRLRPCGPVPSVLAGGRACLATDRRKVPAYFPGSG